MASETETSDKQTRPPSRRSIHRNFQKRLNAALASPDLELALTRALPNFRDKRTATLPSEEFPERQRRLATIKRACIERLPELVDQFVTEATKVGCVVHRARDAAEARAIVAKLAEERGVKLAVKSKSMVAEEIELNPYLEERGIKVVETDLGEWIIQLAHEHPSHILAPALHKTKEQIAEIIGKEVGRDLSKATPQEITAVAREALRESFIRADMGITGANIAIASTGTIVLVTNEGNGRLVSTLPPIHVAVVGVEKIVPTLDEATEVLKLLAPSATGQKLSVYTSFTTGPSRSADIELSLSIGVHGPKEVHIVLVDNGRWKMWNDPEFREALQCIRCGACANVCPPYQVVGGHVFGHVYTGPIGLVVTPFHHGMENAVDPQGLCVSCNACETVCPVGIPLARMILDIRKRKVEADGLPLIKRKAIETLTDPDGFDRSTRLGSFLQKPLASQKFVQSSFLRVLPPFNGTFGWRSLPALASHPLRDRCSEGSGQFTPPRTIPGSRAAGTRVAYFSGCMTDRLYPEMGEAVIRVLRALGCDVFFPPAQSCCGLPAINSGDGPAAQAMIHQTIEAIEKVQCDYILSGSASCVVSILQDYPRLLVDQPEWLARAKRIADRVIDFTGFVDQVAQLPDGCLRGGPPLTVTVHDSCQSHNCLGRHDEARRLLTDVMGHTIVEMRESSSCCGFGGSFSFEHPRVAERIARRKLTHVDQTGAPTVVTDNPGCIMHLRGVANATHRPLAILHLAEVIDRALAWTPA
ncbi:MAG TPA: LUD domain-containing protein [Chloroflexota bacterium]|nr:LUD domain-containing protein [Chloroflexota bacterium]